MGAAVIEFQQQNRGAEARRLENLRGRLRAVLRIARLLLDEVLNDRYRAEQPEKYRDLASKAGGELAMLLRMARRALPDAADQQEIADLASRLVEHARTPDVVRWLTMRPSRAAMYALTHLCLEELGFHNERFDRLARAALRSSVQAANERVPYRILDAAWTRHIAFGDAELAHPAIALSPLGAGVDLLEVSTADAYAFSHALPYATDFGRVPLPVNVDREDLMGIAEALTVKALDEDDMDLLAELLMAPACLRMSWTPVLQFGWRVLESVWDRFGFVPGPGLPPPVDGESRVERVRRVLGTTYHTSFAAGLCCATLIACKAMPPADSQPVTGTPVFGVPGKGAMWKQVWSESQEHTFLSLAFTLRRAIEVMDFAALPGILREAGEHGMLGHPLFFQTIELLERVS